MLEPRFDIGSRTGLLPSTLRLSPSASASLLEVLIGSLEEQSDDERRLAPSLWLSLVSFLELLDFAVWWLLPTRTNIVIHMLRCSTVSTID